MKKSYRLVSTVDFELDCEDPDQRIKDELIAMKKEIADSLAAGDNDFSDMIQDGVVIESTIDIMPIE